jgi:hypothetical protein
MKLAFGLAAWLQLIPLAVLAAVTPELRLLAPPTLTLGALNAVAAFRPSLWKLVLWLDLGLFLASGGAAWFAEPPLLRWILLGSDAALLVLLVVSAVRSFVL